MDEISAEPQIESDRGVSPVIAEILMVTVAVILAVVIAVFVFGLGEQITNIAPQADFQFEEENGTLTITHHSGATMDADNIRIDLPPGASIASPFPSTISSGDSATVTGLSPGDKVRIVWEDDQRETSAIIARFTVGDGGGAGTGGSATPTPTPTPTPADNPPSASIDNVTDNSCEFYNTNSNQCLSGNPSQNPNVEERVEFEINWSATDDNGLSSVTVELEDNNGNVVASKFPTVSGSSASGSATLTDTGGFGDEYTIIVTATDASSQSNTTSATHLADGDDTGSPP